MKISDMIIYGTIRYSENPKEGDNESWWIVVDVDARELCAYYRHLFWLSSYKCKKLSRPMWGEHITVNYGEEPINKEVWGLYKERRLSIELALSTRTASAVWWFPVVADSALIRIREELGLSPLPLNPFHLCLGYLDEERIVK